MKLRSTTRSSLTPLRVCFLTGQSEIADWMLAAVRRMVQEANAEVSLVVHVTERDDDTAKHTGITHHLNRYCCAGVQSVKNAIRRDPQTYTSLSAVEWPDSVTRIQCESQPADRLGVVIPSNVVETIVDACDVVVHFQVGILQGDILTQPKHGVLSFHHGDIRQYRGTPAGFWEFLHDAPRGGVTLQRLTPKLDAGDIIAFTSVDLANVYTWAEVRRRLFRASPDVLTRGMQKLRDPSFAPVTVPDAELGTLYYLSDITLPVQTRYLLKEISGWTRTR